nr:uncharacterized protein LOC110791678 [Spinacia oleracea]
MLTFLHLNSLKAIKINTHTRRNSIRLGRRSVRCDSTVEMSTEKHQIKVSNGDDSVEICRVLNGMWQTSGRWGRIDRDNVVESMLRYSDAGLSTFDMADHYGPAEDLYVIFINRVRRERPPDVLEKVRGLTKWVPSPVKMTRSFVESNINVSRKRMDVSCLGMLQFHWWDYANSWCLDALKHLADLKDEGMEQLWVVFYQSSSLIPTYPFRLLVLHLILPPYKSTKGWLMHGEDGVYSKYCFKC